MGEVDFRTRSQKSLNRLRRRAEAEGLILISKPWPGTGAPGSVTATAIWDLAHDLAHWQIATPEEREMAWYGLGHPVTGELARGPRAKHRDDIELAANHLGLILLSEAGLSDRRLRENMRAQTFGWQPEVPRRALLYLGALWTLEREVEFRRLFQQSRRRARLPASLAGQEQAVQQNAEQLDA